jgi:hypothetical protein
VSIEVDRGDDGGDLRRNKGSEAATTQAHDSVDGDSPTSWTWPLGGAVTVG